MSKVVTLRLPDETAARLEKLAKKADRSVSETGARIIEEGLRMSEFPHIDFETFNGERHACLQGVTQVWLLIMVARSYDFDVKGTAAHFQIAEHRVQAALNYYKAYPEEIDRPLADNDSWTYERLKQTLPQIERFSVEHAPDGVVATPP